MAKIIRPCVLLIVFILISKIQAILVANDEKETETRLQVQVQDEEEDAERVGRSCFQEKINEGSDQRSMDDWYFNLDDGSTKYSSSWSNPIYPVGAGIGICEKTCWKYCVKHGHGKHNGHCDYKGHCVCTY